MAHVGLDMQAYFWSCLNSVLDRSKWSGSLLSRLTPRLKTYTPPPPLPIQHWLRGKDSRPGRFGLIKFFYLRGIERRDLGNPIISLVIVPITSFRSPYVREKELDVMGAFCRRQLFEIENWTINLTPRVQICVFGKRLSPTHKSLSKYHQFISNSSEYRLFISKSY
jgi:hypothetical protein